MEWFSIAFVCLPFRRNAAKKKMKEIIIRKREHNPRACLQMRRVRRGGSLYLIVQLNVSVCCIRCTLYDVVVDYYYYYYDDFEVDT